MTKSNDKFTEVLYSNTPITTYPYTMNFDNTNGGWVSRTTDAKRLFKLDTIPYLNGSQGNNKGWYLEVPVDGSGDVWVESPVFNISGMLNPMLSMDIKYKLSGSNNKVLMQYTTNGGASWTTLGSGDDPQWFNSKTYSSWNDNYANPVASWTKVQHNLCPINGQTCVKFRIATQSMYYNKDRAWFAFDNFKIEDMTDEKLRNDFKSIKAQNVKLRDEIKRLREINKKP